MAMSSVVREPLPNKVTIPCERCGDLRSRAELSHFFGRLICQSCRALPALDLRSKYCALYLNQRPRGARSWFFSTLLVAILIGIALADLTRSGARPWIAIWIYSLALSLWPLSFLAFYILRPGCFYAPYYAVAASAVLCCLGSIDDPSPIGPLLLTHGFIAAVIASAFYNTENRMAYGYNPSDAELEEIYLRNFDNPLAHQAKNLGFTALFIPGLELISLPMAFTARSRINPEGWPPVDQSSTANAAILVSVLCILKDIGLIYAFYKLSQV